MADERPNPLAQNFSEMVTEWERNFDAFANQVMGTEAFSEAMNQTQKSQLVFQKAVAETMTQQLTALNMPTREDMMRVIDALAQMDRRLERIEERMAINDMPRRSKTRPARTKQPPKDEATGDQS